MKGNLKARKAVLLLASMMTMMAGAIVAPALPLIRESFAQVRSADLLVRLVVTLPALAIIPSGPVAGLLCDRVGRRAVFHFGLLMYLLAGTSGYYLNGLYPLLVSRALLGVGIAAIMTSVTTLIGDYFEEKDREKFMGMQGAAIGIGGIIFMSAAGLLAGINWHWPFVIYAFSLPVLLLSMRHISDPDTFGAGKRTDSDENAAVPALPPVRRDLVWLVYITGFLGIVFFFMVPVQVPFLLKGAGIDVKFIGMMISLMSVSAAVVSMNYRKFSSRMRFPAIIGLAFVVMSGGFLSISAATGPAGFSISLLVIGLGVGLLMPTSSLWIMHVVPAARRGTYVGGLTTAMFLGQFLSPVFLQPLINDYEVSGTFSIMSVVLLTSGVLYILLRKRFMPTMPVLDKAAK